MVMMVAIDQYGRRYRIEGKYPRKELLAFFHRKHADKMYRDMPDGGAKQVGYVIAGLWLTLYQPWMKEV